VADRDDAEEVLELAFETSAGEGAPDRLGTVGRTGSTNRWSSTRVSGGPDVKR